MGYCADLVEGKDIVVAYPSKVVDAIADWEDEMNKDKPYGYGTVHMSWCSSVPHYRERCEGDDQKVLAAMLVDFGFYCVSRADGSVVVEGWGGDKIGSTFLEMFQALAKGMTSNVDWILRGEDGVYFAMCINGKTDDLHVGDAWEYGVQTEFKIIKDRYANDGADY